MLPNYVITHPFFHNTLNKEQATQKLLNTESSNGNLLFVPGANNDVILLYKAYFRGQAEVRELILNNHDDSLSSSSLGDHVHLESYVKSLNKFLKGWTSKVFEACAISSAVMEMPSEGFQAIPGLPNELTTKIFNFLDDKTLTMLKLVSKRCGHFAEQAREERAGLAWQTEQATIAQNKEYVNTIFDAITSRLTIAPEGKGQPSERLTLNDMIISEPCQYGSLAIMCYLTAPGYPNTLIRISKNSSEIDVFQHANSKLEDVLLKDIAHLAIEGKTPKELELEEISFTL